MKLEKIRLQNFRSFRDAEVCLQSDLTIFAGENNGGKSNAIDAIRLLTTPLGGRREIYCEPTDVRFHCGSQTFELEAHFSDLSVAQRGRLISAVTDMSMERAAFGLSFDADRPAGSARPSLWAGQPGNLPEVGCHEMVRHVYLPPLRDAKRALASGNPTRIMVLLNHFLEGASAADIAKGLGRITSHPILKRVDDAVAKGLEALTVGARKQSAALGFSSEENLVDIARDLRFKLADHGIEPEDLRYSGHGYANLLYMAIIAVELEKMRSADLTLFLVEEPEAHLHPQLQAAVLCFLQERAEQSRQGEKDPNHPAGELQIVVATHSPNLSAWVPSEKLVVFKSVITPPPSGNASEASAETGAVELHEIGVTGSINPAASYPHEAAAAANATATTTAASDADDTSAGEPASLQRRESRCIPLANLSLEPTDRRKIDRYLDVTKAAFLFGGRTLLIEGVAEALLLPVIAKHHVLKDRPDDYKKFRTAVFVPIEGVDFSPYVQLLMQPHNGVRIADRLVVMTDGDRGFPKEEGKGDGAAATAMPGPAAAAQEANAAADIPPGEARKQALDELASKFGAEGEFACITNTYSLEAELLIAGNAPLMRAVFLTLHPKSAEKWDKAAALAGDEQARAIKAIFESTRKGDFAQLLSHEIEKGTEFQVPKYIKDAIEALIA